MTRTSNEMTRKMLDAAEQLGGVNEGIDGRGHYVIRFRNGERARIAATPSAYSSFRNTLADLQRISGRRLPKVQRNRSRKSFTTQHSRPTVAERQRSAEMAAELDALHCEAGAVHAEWVALVANPTRDGVTRARELLAAWSVISGRFEAIYQPPLPPLDDYSDDPRCSRSPVGGLSGLGVDPATPRAGSTPPNHD